MDETADSTTGNAKRRERRREGRVEYTNPALIALMRDPSASGADAKTDTALLEQRLYLARRVRAYDAAHALSEAAQHGRKIAVAELDACEAECRIRGLIG
ncbi:MAG: hypothetical protein ACREF3_02330 [Acetobacteraceae bacterium]